MCGYTDVNYILKDQTYFWSAFIKKMGSLAKTGETKFKSNEAMVRSGGDGWLIRNKKKEEGWNYHVSNSSTVLSDPEKQIVES